MNFTDPDDASVEITRGSNAHFRCNLEVGCPAILVLSDNTNANRQPCPTFIDDSTTTVTPTTTAPITTTAGIY